MKVFLIKLFFAALTMAVCVSSCSNGEGYPDKAPAPKRRLLTTKADSLQAQRDQAGASKAELEEDN